MAEQDANLNQDKFQQAVLKGVGAAGEKDLSKYRTHFIVIAILVVAGLYFINQSHLQTSAAHQDHVELFGKAMHYNYSKNTDSASIVFKEIVANTSVDELIRAKSHLLLGNIQYNAGQFAEASNNFKQASSLAGSQVIIAAGAEDGLASILMEEKKYAEAITALNAYISKFGGKTGNPAERYSKTEPQDKAANIPHAMIKLALCYKETKDNAKAKEIAEKVIKIYGSTTYASTAKQLLSVL